MGGILGNSNAKETIEDPIMACTWGGGGGRGGGAPGPPPPGGGARRETPRRHQRNSEKPTASAAVGVGRRGGTKRWFGQMRWGSLPAFGACKLGGGENSCAHAPGSPRHILLHASMHAADSAVVPCLLQNTIMPLGFMHPALTLSAPPCSPRSTARRLARDEWGSGRQPIRWACR